MWSIKIFDGEPEPLNLAALELARAAGAGVEVALYASRGFSPRVDSELALLGGQPHALGLHLAHAKTSLIELAARPWGRREAEAARSWGERADRLAASEGSGLSPGAARMAAEAGWARSLGLPGKLPAVIHMDRGSQSDAAAWRGLEPGEFAARALPAIDAAWELGLRLHMEKTYESRAWLGAFYEALFELGAAERFGFAFDLGHSRVWEREPLGGWMGMIERVDELGFGLHFHLHGNEGGRDSHDTLGKAQAMGWLDPDPEWAPEGAMPILRRIQELYERRAMLVLENSTHEAWENIGWVELAMRG